MVCLRAYPLRQSLGAAVRVQPPGSKSYARRFLNASIRVLHFGNPRTPAWHVERRQLDPWMVDEFAGTRSLFERRLRIDEEWHLLDCGASPQQITLSPSEVQRHEACAPNLSCEQRLRTCRLWWWGEAGDKGKAFGLADTVCAMDGFNPCDNLGR